MVIASPNSLQRTSARRLLLFLYVRSGPKPLSFERSAEHPVVQRAVRCATLDEVTETVVAVTGRNLSKSASGQVRLAYAFLASTEALAPLPFRQLLEQLHLRNCRLQM